MDKIEIHADGTVKLPIPGNMKIAVEMTEGIFEEFLQFRRDKEIYDKVASKEISGLRGRMDALARAVLESANGKTPKARKDAKEDALELANDWFC